MSEELTWWLFTGIPSEPRKATSVSLFLALWHAPVSSMHNLQRRLSWIKFLQEEVEIYQNALKDEKFAANETHTQVETLKCRCSLNYVLQNTRFHLENRTAQNPRGVWPLQLGKGSAWRCALWWLRCSGPKLLIILFIFYYSGGNARIQIIWLYSQECDMTHT